MIESEDNYSIKKIKALKKQDTNKLQFAIKHEKNRGNSEHRKRDPVSEK